MRSCQIPTRSRRTILILIFTPTRNRARYRFDRDSRPFYFPPQNRLIHGSQLLEPTIFSLLPLDITPHTGAEYRSLVPCFFTKVFFSFSWPILAYRCPCECLEFLDGGYTVTILQSRTFRNTINLGDSRESDFVELDYDQTHERSMKQEDMGGKSDLALGRF